MSRKFAASLISLAFALNFASPAQAAYRFSSYRGRPPIHSLGQATAQPAGLNPATVKKIYGLPESGGSGTIAIVAAYDSPSAEADLAVFSRAFGLPECAAANGCFRKKDLGAGRTNSGWAMETALDIEWAHAIAPNAKILLVEAATPSGPNLLAAVDYAAKQPGVVSVSMSWGGAEFPEEASLEPHFAKAGVTFFASSGDSGAGANWPAASPSVVSVGGTTVRLGKGGKLQSETAWSGSGGGLSAYFGQPDYQAGYSISRSQNRRSIPDVAYCADPAAGFSVYHASGSSKKGWRVVGGTSAGAPQWAAINALGGGSANNANFYADKASAKNGKFFRDIRSGTNGDCGYYCSARLHYDFVTGLGSPLTASF